jgi:hypothetical protein
LSSPQCRCDPLHGFFSSHRYDTTALTITSTGDANGMKMDLSNYGADGYGELIWLWSPTGANNQQWTYDASSGLLRTNSDKTPPSEKDMCISAAPLPDVSGQLWCNASLPIDERVADMVSRMTLTEKIANLDTGGGTIRSLGLSA